MASRKQLQTGSAFLVCKHQIAEGVGLERGTASQALVVETLDGGQTGEVDVLFATALRAVQGESSGEQCSVLLRH